MMRAALSGWKGGSGGVSYPSASTTGPAAGGYSSLTPVTLTASQNINQTGNPTWVGTDGSGNLLVQNVAFTLQNNAAIVVKNTLTTPITFQGCSFDGTAGQATTTGPSVLVLQTTNSATVSYCSFFGDGTGATRIMLAITQGADNNLTIENCDIGYMKQAAQLWDVSGGTTQSVLIQNNYFHDVIEYNVVAPTPTVAAGLSGGSITAGTYNVVITYATANGQCIASPSVPVTVSGTQKITITSPPTLTGWTDWYAWVSPAGSTSLYYQQQSSPGTGIGSDLILSTTPTTSGSSSPPDIDHSEPIYDGASFGRSDVTISGNTLLNPINQTAALYMHNTVDFSNYTVSGNLFAGGGYAVYCGHSGSTNVVFENNLFSTRYYALCGQSGAAYPTTPPPFNVSGGNLWTGNTWDGMTPAAGGTPAAAGTTVTHP